MRQQRPPAPIPIQLDYELDDMLRRAKLAVLSRRGDLAEPVFIEIPLDIAIALSNMLAADDVYVVRREVLEPRPVEVIVETLLPVVVSREDATLDRLLEPGRLALFERMQIVEPFDE